MPPCMTMSKLPYVCRVNWLPTMLPWVIISSVGFHTVLQTQYSLGMTLTEESESGSILGKMAAYVQGGGSSGFLPPESEDEYPTDPREEYEREDLEALDE